MMSRDGQQVSRCANEGSRNQMPCAEYYVSPQYLDSVLYLTPRRPCIRAFEMMRDRCGLWLTRRGNDTTLTDSLEPARGNLESATCTYMYALLDMGPAILGYDPLFCPSDIA
jgi:hypothetical protein